jgi:ABC-type uncharacterized transport system YnjBCD permease subunit
VLFTKENLQTIEAWLQLPDFSVTVYVPIFFVMGIIETELPSSWARINLELLKIKQVDNVSKPNILRIFNILTNVSIL